MVIKQGFFNETFIIQTYLLYLQVWFNRKESIDDMSKNIKTTFSKGIIIPSVIFIITISFFAAVFPSKMANTLEVTKNFIFVNLNWVLIWSVAIFIIFLIYLMFSKYGKIRLGSNDSRPEHSFFSWVSMLFAAGMGIGLMYFAVAEPMQHYTDPAFAHLTASQRVENAQLNTFFHWGMHAWAIYALVGLALAYFSFRYKLPLSLRSCLYPILKNKINGKWGNAIDVFAFSSTFFGIVTSLGFGVVQVNAGLDILGFLPSTEFKYQVLIILALVSLAILSSISGVNKGIKILSTINIFGVILLLFFILFGGPTTYLISSFTNGVGNYISEFFTLTFNTHAYSPEELPWFFNWTILYWAWWISWAPFVGLFIARISKGRTIREFVAAVLILPTLFNIIWMSVLGNSAMWVDSNVAGGALSKLASNPEALTFEFLKYLPFSKIISVIVILVIIIFFVTSADSGILVMDSIATQDSKKSPKWQNIVLGSLLALLALLLLNVGGLEALQTMTLITALPFTVIMLMFIVSLFKALSIDNEYFNSSYSIYTVPWSGRSWKEKLGRVLTFNKKKTVDNYIKYTVASAFKELQKEFEKNDVIAEVVTSAKPQQVELRIKYENIEDFIYGVKTDFEEIPDYVHEDDNFPNLERNRNYIAKAYFGDSREGYDVQMFSANELIGDVIKHFDRYFRLVSDSENELFIRKPDK